MNRREFLDYLDSLATPDELTPDDIIESYHLFSKLRDDEREKVLKLHHRELLAVATKRFRDNAVRLLMERKPTLWVNGMLLKPRWINEEMHKKWEQYIPDGTSPEICRMAIKRILGIRI